MPQPKQTTERRSESGVFRRIELDRAMRLNERELRALLASGALDELLDADDGDGPEFEY